MRKSLIAVVSAMFIGGSAFSAMAGNHGGDKHPEGGHHKHMDKMFDRMDSNSDGAVSKDEFISHAEKRFMKMDADNDGSVTKEEAKKHHEEKRAKHKEMRENDKSE